MKRIIITCLCVLAVGHHVSAAAQSAQRNIDLRDLAIAWLVDGVVDCKEGSESTEHNLLRNIKAEREAGTLERLVVLTSNPSTPWTSFDRFDLGEREFSEGSRRDFHRVPDGSYYRSWDQVIISIFDNDDGTWIIGIRIALREATLTVVERGDCFVIAQARIFILC